MEAELLELEKFFGTSLLPFSMLLDLIVTTSSSMLSPQIVLLSASIRASLCSIDDALTMLDLWPDVQYFEVIGCSSISNLKIFDEEFDESWRTGKKEEQKEILHFMCRLNIKRWQLGGGRRSWTWWQQQQTTERKNISKLTFPKLNFTLELPFVLINRLSADNGRRLWHKLLPLRDVNRFRW